MTNTEFFSKLVFRDYIEKFSLKKSEKEIKEKKRNDTIKEKGEVATEDKKFVLKIEKPLLKRKFSLKVKEKMEQHQLNKRIKRENRKKELKERLDEDTEKLKQIKSAYICTFCLFVYY